MFTTQHDLNADKWRFNPDFTELQVYLDGVPVPFAKGVNPSELDDADLVEEMLTVAAAAPDLAAMLRRWVEEWGEFDEFGVPKDDLTRESVAALVKAGLTGEWSEHLDA